MPPRTHRNRSVWPPHFVGRRANCRFLLINDVWEPFGLTTRLVGLPIYRSTDHGPIVEAAFAGALATLDSVAWDLEACRFWRLPVIDEGPPDVPKKVAVAMTYLEAQLGPVDADYERRLARRQIAEEIVSDYVWAGDASLKEQAFVNAQELILTARVSGAWVRHGNCSDAYQLHEYPWHFENPWPRSVFNGE